MSETLQKTLCACLIVIGGLWAGSYVTYLERRVTALEDRVNSRLVIPLPPYNVPAFREGEEN